MPARPIPFGLVSALDALTIRFGDPSLPMPPIKLAHAADLHLGRPFSGLAAKSPHIAELILSAGYTAWARIVDTVIESKADLLTLAGDVFDSANPPLRARLAFRDGIARLREHGVPVFLALGNHDPVEAFPEALGSLDGLTLFGAAPEGHAVELGGASERVVVYGASYDRPAVRENLVKKFRRDPDAKVAVGVVHANVSGSSGHDDYAPCSLADLREARMDVWLLGHVHKHVVLSSDPLVVYAGTSQPAHINEEGPGGFCVIDIDARGHAECAFVPVSPVIWRRTALDVTGIGTEEELVTRGLAEIKKVKSAAPFCEATIARLDLIGNSSLPWLGSSETLQELRDAISGRLDESVADVALEAVCNSARREIPLDLLAGRNDFFSEFLSLREQCSSCEDLGRKLRERIIREISQKPWAKYLSWEEICAESETNPDEWTHILAEAEELVAELFLAASGTETPTPGAPEPKKP